MQFLVTLTPEGLTSSPTELQSAMSEFVETERQTGTFAFTGGLASHADDARVELSSTGLRHGDPRLPIRGFAVVEAPSPEDAVEVAARMLRLHQKYVPNWAGNCEVRPIVTHCVP